MLAALHTPSRGMTWAREKLIPQPGPPTWTWDPGEVAGFSPPSSTGVGWSVLDWTSVSYFEGFFNFFFFFLIIICACSKISFWQYFASGLICYANPFHEVNKYWLWWLWWPWWPWWPWWLGTPPLVLLLVLVFHELPGSCGLCIMYCSGILALHKKKLHLLLPLLSLPPFHLIIKTAE